MVNHPNRGWRKRWSVDLGAGTATHIDGWIFSFPKQGSAPEDVVGTCTTIPKGMTILGLANSERIAQEANQIFQECLAEQ